jgi:nucleoside-diphosphate-sugar epimerase
LVVTLFVCCNVHECVVAKWKIESWWNSSLTLTGHCFIVFNAASTISVASYGPGNGEVVNESSPLPESTMASPRSLRLVKAEENVLSGGGCVLRLAGLYTLDRGAHNYWLEKSGGVVKGSKDGIINLLHYDDAAGACLAALTTDSNVQGKVFLISDGNPTTRVGICESALKAKKYQGLEMPSFGDEDGSAGKGKIYDGTFSNAFLKWKPRYESFDKFMTSSQ